MKSKPLTASLLRILLCIILLLVTIVGSVGFSFMYNNLQGLAETISKSNTEAEASKNQITAYKSLREKLNSEKNTINKITKMIAESQSYAYQDQIIADINNYAQKAGISVTSISFGGASIPTNNASTPAPSSSNKSTAPKSSTSDSTVGLKTASAIVTLENPVDYKKLLTFMHYIEQNLTKMQIANVSLSKSGSDGNQVTTNALTINVYVR